MPTYQNITDAVIVVDGITFNPYGTTGDTQTTKRHMIDPRLTMLYSYPYWNPATATSEVSGAINTTITLQSDTNTIEVYNGSNINIRVYLNSLNNTPGLPVPPNSIRYIENLKKTTNRVIIDPEGVLGPGDCFITELI